MYVFGRFLFYDPNMLTQNVYLHIIYSSRKYRRRCLSFTDLPSFKRHIIGVRGRCDVCRWLNIRNSGWKLLSGNNSGSNKRVREKWNNKNILVWCVQKIPKNKTWNNFKHELDQNLIIIIFLLILIGHGISWVSSN